MEMGGVTMKTGSVIDPMELMKTLTLVPHVDTRELSYMDSTSLIHFTYLSQFYVPFPNRDGSNGILLLDLPREERRQAQGGFFSGGRSTWDSYSS